MAREVARARDAAHTGSRLWELVMSWIVWAAAIVRSLLRIAPRAPSRPLVRTGDPVTTIQVRLHGGRRLAVQLNRDAPVSHLRRAVECEMFQSWTATSGASTHATWVCPPFDLVAGFPPRLIDAAPGITLESHSPPLVGAAVTQRMQAQATRTD